MSAPPKPARPRSSASGHFASLLNFQWPVEAGPEPTAVELPPVGQDPEEPVAPASAAHHDAPPTPRVPQATTAQVCNLLKRSSRVLGVAFSLGESGPRQEDVAAAIDQVASKVAEHMGVAATPAAAAMVADAVSEVMAPIIATEGLDEPTVARATNLLVNLSRVGYAQRVSGRSELAEGEALFEVMGALKANAEIAAAVSRFAFFKSDARSRAALVEHLAAAVSKEALNQADKVAGESAAPHVRAMVRQSVLASATRIAVAAYEAHGKSIVLREAFMEAGDLARKRQSIAKEPAPSLLWPVLASFNANLDAAVQAALINTQVTDRPAVPEPSDKPNL